MRRAWRAGLALAWLALAGMPAQAAFEGCLALFPQRHVPQLPQGFAQATRPLCFDGFAILYSATSKTPVYAVERLNRRDFEGAAKHQRGRNPFYEEARLPRAERATLQDYRTALPDGQRMDRGHVVPAGDMTQAQGFAQSFSLANMVPQVPAANQGPWNRIEQDTRRYVRRARGDVYVVTGPVFGPQPARLGPGRVWVPEAMFKLVYDASTNRAWAHWLPNSAGAHVQPPITYEALTHRIGLRLLQGEPDD
ncbi:DNA/RNA non-specific endonuclease [Pseudorhodoferax sp. Leaf274]|uniref:DNA/RNA non-specific endonuclease n=1 Tax=Pseudorhodoferax sp. Leaf274 TaxID=1736318 RepID=UPI00138F50FC|nr:DNA/RNA non-specific endonuclease [Pseudorhodoferax sp. Leaf274]